MSGGIIDGGLVIFAHGAPGGISLSPKAGDNITSELLMIKGLFDFSNLGKGCVIDIRSCNSGTVDGNTSSIAKAFHLGTGMTTIGYPTPSPHTTGLNFSSTNSPYNPSPGELTNPKGPLYLVPMKGSQFAPVTYSGGN